MKKAIFDFGKIHERRWTGSIKYDKYMLNKKIPKEAYPPKLLPMWVADTNFKTPDSIIQAMKERADHGLFGYTSPRYGDIRVLQDYLSEAHGLEAHHEDIIVLPGLMVALSLVSKLAKKEEVGVLTNTPIYPPFIQLPRVEKAHLVTSPLKIDKITNKYTFDFEDMEKGLSESKTKVGWYIHCNPHNPTGRSFSYEELEKLSEFCKKHSLKVCSDEVHCPLVFDKAAKHITFEKIFGEKDLVTLFGPGKAFNLAGLGCSFAVIKDPALKLRFQKEKRGIVPDLNIFGLVAMTAAYSEVDCKEYNSSLVEYLKGNYSLLKKHLGPIGVLTHDMEATYLAFLNTKKLFEHRGENISSNVNSTEKLLNDFSIGLNDARFFGVTNAQGGNPYEDYSRLNFAVPRKELAEALSRMLGKNIDFTE